jgi:Xaa-Pro aminopeptidase
VSGTLETNTELEARRRNLLHLARAVRTRAFLTTALTNVRYLAGFTGSNAALLLTDDRAILFTDPRYQTQAPLESDCEVKIVKGPLLPHVAKWLKRLHVKVLGFERNRLSYDEYEQLREAAADVSLRPLAGFVETLRMVKSPAEIGAIRASVQLNSAALEQALRSFKSDMTEADLAAEIDYRMRVLGADGTSFDTIVASGARTALPHAHPGELPIQTNELLLIDMGASLGGYASDMTRTHAVGKVNAKMRRMYRAVLESQLAALAAVRPGVTCTAVDRAARTVLRGYGLEKQFIHSTGHGLGLEIHERPRLGRKDPTRLAAGMAITIEPGVYEESVGGVRIEDTVVVTDTGCEVLTPTGKELVVL